MMLFKNSKNSLLLCTLACALLCLTACKETRDDKAPTVQPPGPASAPAVKGDATKAADKAASAPASAPAGDKAAGMDHAAWDGLLKKYVTEAGPVKYKDWKGNAEDFKALNAYVGKVGATDLSKLDKKEHLPFLINAYNALTIKAVLERYPLASGSVLKLQGEDFFKGIKHKVAGEEMTLDVLENKKIREGFGEARIHFVVNCASTSCPKIQRDALTVANLEATMEAATKAYVQKETKVVGGSISTSKIFEWFEGDFKKASGSRGAFLAKYLEGDAAKLAKEGKIKTHTYDWALNEAK